MGKQLLYRRGRKVTVDVKQCFCPYLPRREVDYDGNKSFIEATYDDHPPFRVGRISEGRGSGLARRFAGWDAFHRMAFVGPGGSYKSKLKYLVEKRK